jgi:uncharacterized protein (DUF1015 family)
MPGMTDHPSVVGTVHENAGLVLTAFRGLRYAPDRVADLGAVTSPPYDVVDDEEERRLKAAEPHNVVRLILPRDDDSEPEERNPATEGRYRHVAQLLRTWVADGTLIADLRPTLYVYQQRTPTTIQRGLIGAVGLREPDERIVLPHEDVLPGPVNDRLELMRSAQANLEPIYLLYEGAGRASEIVDEVASIESPTLAAAADATEHWLWPLTDASRLNAIADDLRDRQALIADGHHRYATYLRLRDERWLAGDGPGPWDFGLALLVDSTAYPPEVRAIHRVVGGLSHDLALARAAEHFSVRPLTGPVEDALAELARTRSAGSAFILTDGDRIHLLTEPDRQWLIQAVRPDRPPTVRDLDATLMTDGLLASLWGIGDDERRVRYEHDPFVAVRHAAELGGTAVLLRPTRVGDVMAVAAAGARMPRKSTSFGPKPRTGLVLRTFDTQ